VFKFAWVDAPKWLAAALGLALGWGGLVVLPQLIARLSPAAVVLLGVGGLAYTLGAIVYARRRPDPAPAVFGYHELFQRADDRRSRLPVRRDRVLRPPRRLARARPTAIFNLRSEPSSCPLDLDPQG
jgi:hypothetical protein